MSTFNSHLAPDNIVFQVGAETPSEWLKRYERCCASDEERLQQLPAAFNASPMHRWLSRRNFENFSKFRSEFLKDFAYGDDSEATPEDRFELFLRESMDEKVPLRVWAVEARDLARETTLSPVGSWIRFIQSPLGEKCAKLAPQMKNWEMLHSIPEAVAGVPKSGKTGRKEKTEDLMKGLAEKMAALEIRVLNEERSVQDTLASKLERLTAELKSLKLEKAEKTAKEKEAEKPPAPESSGKIKRSSKYVNVCALDKAEKPGMPIVTGVVENGLSVKCLLDSGSEVNLITETKAKQSGLKLLPVSAAVTGLGRTKFPTIAFIKDVRMNIGRRKIKTDFYVIKKGIITTDCVVGGPSLRHHKLIKFRCEIPDETDAVDPELADPNRPCMSGKVTGVEDPKHGMVFEIKIKPGATLPVCRPYPESKAKTDFLKTEIPSLLKEKMIERSDGECSVPATLPRKSDGSFRLCGDYRKLNDITVDEVYPFPRVDQILQQVGGMKMFTTLDLKSGYWQVQIAKESRKYTTFICSLGTFQWRQMAFGLKNAPRFFQKLMDKVFKEVIGKGCFVYIDDIVIYGTDKESHDKVLKRVLELLDEAGLKLNLAKCKFRQSELTFLGHTISEKGVRPSADKLETVGNLKEPKTRKQLASLIGFLNYFRRFIPNFPDKAAALYELNKEKKFGWKEKHQQAVEKIKTDIMNAPWLGTPDWDTLFYLETDASMEATSGILYQMRGDEKVIIECFSKRLKDYETRYAATELECLAVYRAIEALDRYLCGVKFVIVSDNRALQWLFKNRQKNKRLERWVMALQGYDFSVEYKPGTENLAADALSRLTPTQEGEKQVNLIRQAVDCQEVIKLSHQRTGHGGVLATYKCCKENEKGTDVTIEMVKQWVAQCQACQKYTSWSPEGPRFSVTVSRPFECVAMDIVGPLPETSRGNRYLLLAVDYLTHWAEVRALKQKSGAEVAKFIQEQICDKWIRPERILTDNGTEFTNRKVNRLMEALGIKHSLSSPYYPQGNGLAERTNQTIAQKMWKASANREAWDYHLAEACRGYNSSFQKRMKASPLQVLCGKDSAAWKSASKEDIVSDRARELQEQRTIDLRTNREDLEIRNSSNDWWEPKEGDWIYRKSIQPESIREGKGASKYKGPFQVLKKVAFNQYEIREGPEKTALVNRRALKPASLTSGGGNDIPHFTNF